MAFALRAGDAGFALAVVTAGFFTADFLAEAFLSAAGRVAMDAKARDDEGNDHCRSLD